MQSNSLASYNTIGAVLLAGGLSTRMGQDKANLHPYGAHSPNLLARTYEILNHHFSNVWVSCAKEKPREGYNCIFDEFDEIGPISGIYTGLNAAKQAGLEAILVLPCDLPLMYDKIIKMLIHARNTHKAQVKTNHNLMTTFLHEQNQNIEALVSIYEVETLSLFQHAIAQGIRAPRLVIHHNVRTYIPYTSDISEAFYNLNTCAEYHSFKKKYAAE